MDIDPLLPDRNPFGWGFLAIWQAGMLLVGLVVFSALVLIAVLLVRYLLVATRAAQLYVEAHAPSAPAASEAPPTTTAAAPPPPAPAPADPVPPASDPTPPDVPRVARPPRSRTPKTPPADS